MKRSDDQIDQFDPDKRHDETAETVDEQVALQDGERAHRFVSDAAQRQRNQRDDDEGIENDGAQDGAGRGVQMHDVERRNGGKRAHQHRGNNREVFRYIVRDTERGE